jgi:hypothetical protein
VLAVLRKDLVEQLVPLGFASAVVLGGLAALLAQRLFEGGDPFSALQPWALLGLLPLAWWAVRRLVVEDLLGPGRDLLERLPVAVGPVVASKAALSAILITALAAAGVAGAGALATAIGQAPPRAQVEHAFEQILACALVVQAALLFAAALGRHRHALLAGAAALSLLVGREGAAVGPLSLLTDDLTDPTVPGAGLAGGLWAGGLLVGAIVISSSRAPWARRLRRPAGPVDALRACVLVGALAVLGQLWAPAGGGALLEGPLAAAASGGRVFVRRPHDGAELAQELADELGAAVGALGEGGPAVYVEAAPGLSGFQRGQVPGRPALLVRADVATAALDRSRLRAFVQRAALDGRTSGRLRSGAGRLVLEGAPDLASGVRQLAPAREELRVAWALERLSAQGLGAEAWILDLALARRVAGELPARALAAWALERARERSGEEARPFAEGLMRALAAARQGVFGGLGGGAAALRSRLAQSGVPWRAWIEDLDGAGADLRARRAADLSALPRLGGVRLSLSEPDVRGRRALRFGVEPVPGGGRFALSHGFLGPLAQAVPRDADRDEAPLGASLLDTARRYPRGARIGYAFSRYAPELGCDLTLGWEEVQVP